MSDSKERPKIGAWRKFPDIYKKPEDAILQTLRMLRANPQAFFRDETSVPSSKPLALEKELEMLLKVGAIGDAPTALVTISEFRDVAAGVWGLNYAQEQRLFEETLHEAERKVQEQLQQSRAEMAQVREKKQLFILRTWSPERFTLLEELLLGLNTSPEVDFKISVTRFNALELPKVLELQARVEKVINQGNQAERRIELDLLTGTVLDVIHRLVYTTDDEVDLITSTEQRQGYLFLDSLASAASTFYRTAAVAKKRAQSLQLQGSHTSGGEEAFLLDQREQAINGLLYGANTSTSTRSLSDRIRRRARPSPSTSQRPSKNLKSKMDN